MKVDLTGLTGSTIDNVTSTQRTPAEQAAISNVEPNTADDAATVSVDSARMTSMVAKATSAPEIREDKVEALRQAIANGQYNIDPAQIADAMIRDSQ